MNQNTFHRLRMITGHKTFVLLFLIRVCAPGLIGLKTFYAFSIGRPEQLIPEIVIDQRLVRCEDSLKSSEVHSSTKTKLTDSEKENLEKLLVTWHRLFDRIARNYRIPGYEIDDLVSIAKLEITLNFRKFDPKLGEFQIWASVVARRRFTKLLKKTLSRKATFSLFDINGEIVEKTNRNHFSRTIDFDLASDLDVKFFQLRMEELARDGFFSDEEILILNLYYNLNLGHEGENTQTPLDPTPPTMDEIGYRLGVSGRTVSYKLDNLKKKIRLKLKE